MVSQDRDILSSLVDDGHSVIEVFSTVVRTLHDEVDRSIHSILCLEDIFFLICSYIQEVTELCCILRKSDKRSVDIMRHLETMLRAIRCHCSECIRVHNHPSFRLETCRRVYAESDLSLVAEKKHRIVHRVVGLDLVNGLACPVDHTTC